MSVSTLRAVKLLVTLLGAAACTGPSPAALRAAKAPPPPSPRGIVAAFPPQDPSFTPLRCLPQGQSIECKRQEN